MSERSDSCVALQSNAPLWVVIKLSTLIDVDDQAPCGDGLVADVRIAFAYLCRTERRDLRAMVEHNWRDVDMQLLPETVEVTCATRAGMSINLAS